MKLKKLIAVALCCLVAACVTKGTTLAGDGYVKLDRKNFQTDVDGKKTDLFTIVNNKGMSASITNYGGRLVQVIAPDRDGNPGDVVLGYDNIQKILDAPNFIGVFVGRFANRINQGRFSIDGVEYQATLNNGKHSLHGGVKGSRFLVLDGKQLSPNAVQLTYTFQDGEEGFPGTLPWRVVYSLSDDNELVIDYSAVAVDKPTIVNFTSHAFFNLSGKLNSSIEDHLMKVEADRFMPVDDALIPTGELKPVEGTPMDFREFKPIGRDINADYDQLRLGKGYDLNYIIRKDNVDDMTKQATVIDPKSGRKLEAFSTEPGMQFFSGNFFGGKPPYGKGELPIEFRSGFCLEPQHYPDSPNRPEFPNVVLRKGDWYTGRIVYKFSVEQ